MEKRNSNTRKLSLTDYRLKDLSNCVTQESDIIQDQFIKLFLDKNRSLHATKAEVAVAMRRVFGFDSIVLASELAKLHSGKSSKSIKTLKTRVLEQRLTFYKKRPEYLKTIEKNKG